MLCLIARITALATLQQVTIWESSGGEREWDERGGERETELKDGENRRKKERERNLRDVGKRTGMLVRQPTVDVECSTSGVWWEEESELVSE